MADLMGNSGVFPALFAGLVLAGILAATMSTADSQMLAASFSVAQNFFKGLIDKKASNHTVMWAARGTIIVEASIVPKAPSGHRMEISQMPGADMVPIPTFVTKPTVTTATMASATRVRSFLEFFFMRTPYPSTSSRG